MDSILSYLRFILLEKVVHIHLDSVSSTNTYAKENHLHFDSNAVTRITADVQTAGRGRLRRHWISPNEGNIYATYFFTCKKQVLSCNTIGQVFSIKIVKLLSHFPLKVSIKWPNDILVNEKKIAGILCETIDLHDRFGVILGAGINVNMRRDTLQSVGQAATSLYVELGMKQKRAPLLEKLDTFFYDEYPRYQREGFHPFYPQYQALLSHKSRLLSICQNGTLFSGTFHSLHLDGRLNVLLEDGEIQTFSSGDILNR